MGQAQPKAFVRESRICVGMVGLSDAMRRDGRVTAVGRGESRGKTSEGRADVAERRSLVQK